MKNNYYKKITGWFDFADFYSFIARKLVSGNIVEIGVWQGKSVMYLAEKIKESGKELEITAIDTFEGTGNAMLQEAGLTSDQLFELFLKNIEPCKHIITKVLRQSSHDAYSNFADNSIDFLFIDGDHSYEAVKKDLELWYPKVKPGSIISGHDYTELYCYGVVKAVDEFFAPEKIRRYGKFVWYYYKPL